VQLSDEGFILLANCFANAWILDGEMDLLEGELNRLGLA
jgi:hypothetical protein